MYGKCFDGIIGQRGLSSIFFKSESPSGGREMGCIPLKEMNTDEYF